MTTIDMILHCPKCGVQHVDAPELNPYRNAEHYGAAPEARWMNPPHRSHLCHGCGCVWRPADVPTNGVQAITTRGEADTWPDGVAPAARVAYGTIAERAQAGKDVGWWDAPGVETGALSPICTYPACGGGCDDCPGPAPANGVPVAHPTQPEQPR